MIRVSQNHRTARTLYNEKDTFGVQHDTENEQSRAEHSLIIVTIIVEDGDAVTLAISANYVENWYDEIGDRNEKENWYGQIIALEPKYWKHCYSFVSLRRSCYLMPAMPATPASYIKGTATDNCNVEKSTCKSVQK